MSGQGRGPGSTPAQCRNCATVLQAGYEFCPHCGQETHEEPPRFLEFVHEFITHYVALEGRLWKSLWLLLARPGQLTQEYLAGRKNRYVWPLRLFLTLSFVFFLTLKLMPSTEPLVEADTRTATAAAAAASTAASAQAADGSNTLKLRVLDSSRLPEGLRQRLARFEGRMESNPSQELERIGQTLYNRLPTLILLFQPLFAALLALLFMPRRMPYGAHFVFALHLHAFWYLCLWLAWVLPFPLVHFCLWVWSNLYAVLALKRVYGFGWPGTVARAGGLAALHCLGLGALLVGQLTLAAIT